MGVKTQITLEELHSLFPSYNFTKITPTTSGIIDTTYIVANEKQGYILKKYERDIPHKITQDKQLLEELHTKGFNVPICLDECSRWYLYSKLEGSQLLHVQCYHIQALGRFLATLHKETAHLTCRTSPQEKEELFEALDYVKKHHFAYYKKFEFLKYFKHESNAFIHGDIFKDNTLFDGKKIGVIDFIDSTCGSYLFDAAVALVGFDVGEKNHSFINMFLQAYNQRATTKLKKKELINTMKTASHFYALKRIYMYKNTKKAKELLK